jgi:four helix bundle protein
MTKNELEKRLVDFSVSVLELIQSIEKNAVTTPLSNQIIRSSTSSALNYGEAQSAETKRDFIHKVGIVLKELRETQINLMIISNLKSHKGNVTFRELIKENDELIAIFHKTIQTSRKSL